MLDAIIVWLDSTSLNSTIQNAAWAWPAMETIHFIGLILLLGGLLFIDLVLIGIIKGVSFNAIGSLSKVVILAFIINLITGLLFIIGDPGRYFINIGFQLKMLFVILAGLNALWYTFKTQPKIIDANNFIPNYATIVAGVLSIVFWFAVLIFGRLIPYIGTG